MFFNVRIYKQHDTDLLMLAATGFPLAGMIANALNAYAHGTPLFYLLEGVTYADLKDKKCVRVRMELTDPETIKMFSSVTNQYKNMFCKTALRNTLIQQNLNCFFTQDSEGDYQQDNYKIKTGPAYPGLMVIRPSGKFIKDPADSDAPKKKREKKEQQETTTIEQNSNSNIGSDVAGKEIVVTPDTVSTPLTTHVENASVASSATTVEQHQPEVLSEPETITESPQNKQPDIAVPSTPQANSNTEAENVTIDANAMMAMFAGL